MSGFDSPPRFIAYPKAFKLLADRLEATPEEIAAWIWKGPNKGGLAAYSNANELEPPPRFYFDHYMGEDYLAPLMACWFLADDVSKFQPADRFITGKALIKRWRKQPGIKRPKSFILVKIAESDLLDAHPTFSGTRGSFPDDESFPPLKTGLFALSQVKEIESGFGSDATESPTDTKLPGHLNHDPQMQQRANEIAAELTTSTGRVPTKNKVAKKIANELKKNEGTVLRRIRKQW